MSPPTDLLEVFLQPGETFFADRNTRIRTLLGSCVSITLWHRRHLIGGMCHFMLPWRGRADRSGLDGRYGDEAIAILLEEIIARGTRPEEYEAKIFGGGAMFSERTLGRPREFEVGQQNVLSGLTRMETHGFQVKARHLGGEGHRNIIFDVWSGDVWVKHTAEAVSTARPAVEVE